MNNPNIRRLVFLAISSLMLLSSCSSNGIPPEKRGHKKILVLGDSLTDGAGLPTEQVFPAVLARLIREKGYPEVTVTVDGEYGALAQSGPGRFAQRASEGYDILILELGANNGLRGMSLGEMKVSLAEVIAAAQKANMKVLLACTRVPPLQGTQYKADFRQVYEDLAKQYKCGLVPSLLKGVAANRSMNLPDGIHPNSMGHERVAKTVLKYLEGML